jgi:hypothetical protein
MLWSPTFSRGAFRYIRSARIVTNAVGCAGRDLLPEDLEPFGEKTPVDWGHIVQGIQDDLVHLLAILRSDVLTAGGQ